MQQRKTQEKHRFRKREKIDYGGNSGDPLHFQRHQPLGCTIVIRLFTHSRLGHEARPVSDTKVRKIRGVIESTLRQLCECGIEESQIQGARVEYQSGPIKGAHLLKAMRSQVSASRTNNGSKSNCSRGCPHLFTEPRMRGFLIQSRMPRHEIGEWLDFSWRFHQTYAFEGPNNLGQYSWHSQHQVRVSNCKHGCREEWNAEDNTPLRTNLSERTIHGSLLARPCLDHYVRKL